MSIPSRMDEVIAESNIEEFGQYIQAFMQTYYRQDIGVSGCYLWFMSFSGKCTLRQFMDVTTAYANESLSGRRLPQPVPGDIHHRLDGGSKSNNAWNRVLYAIKHFGSSYSVNFLDPRIHHAISRMGGWTELCHSIGKRQEQDVFKEFMSHYVASAGVNNLVPLAGAYGKGSPSVTFKPTDEGKVQLAFQKPIARIAAH